jgi:RES domain-containing protein
MVQAWRITKAKHQQTAFDGRGAALAGGRWNSRGVPAVYVAGTLALATLEMLVHLHSTRVLSTYSSIEVEIPKSLIEALDLAGLPSDWDSYPVSEDVQRLGDEWLSGMSAVALRVPSAIIPTESNFLLNPRHPDFGRIAKGSPKPYGFDPRLLKPA